MALLTLRPNWPAAEFRRTLTGQHGETIRKLVFPKGLPVEIDEALLPLLAHELAAEALVPCELDEKGRLRLRYPEPPGKPRATAEPPAPPPAAEAATDAPPADDEPVETAESRKRKAESRKPKADK